MFWKIAASGAELREFVGRAELFLEADCLWTFFLVANPDKVKQVVIICFTKKNVLLKYFQYV